MKQLVTVAILLAALSVPARAASTGVIEGVVVDAATNDPRSGVRVTLHGADADGGNAIKETVVTDKSGAYRFSGLATGESRFYTIDAVFQGGLFPSRALTLPADTTQRPVIETTLQVWETTTDPAAVLITRDDSFLLVSSTGIGVIEAVTVVNQTGMAYIGRAPSSSSAETRSTLGFALPVPCEEANVTIVDSDLDVPTIACSDFGFAITSAVPPGEARITFRYRVPGETGTFDLTRTALYDIAEMSIYAADPLTIDSNRLYERGEVTLAGKNYRRWTTRTPVDAGDSVQIVATASATWGPGLIAGVGATIALLALIAFWAFRRARQPRVEQVSDAAEEADLVEAIARLDIEYEKGRLSKEDWSARRRALKDRLAATR